MAQKEQFKLQPTCEEMQIVRLLDVAEGIHTVSTFVWLSNILLCGDPDVDSSLALPRDFKLKMIFSVPLSFSSIMV